MDLILIRDYHCYIENIEKHFKKGDVIKNAKTEAVKLLFDEAGVATIARAQIPPAPKIVVKKVEPKIEPKKVEPKKPEPKKVVEPKKVAKKKPKKTGRPKKK